MPSSPPSGSPLTAALVDFHKRVKTIHESSRAQYGTYADLSTVLAEILPKLAEQGIRLSQSFRPWGEDGSGMILITSLKHVSGEEERSELPLIPARSSKGNPLHDWGGAVTYMRRYAILSILGLAAGIPDDDGDSFDGAATASPSKASRPAPKPAAATTNGASKAAIPAQAAALSADELQGIKRAISSLDAARRDAVVSAFKQQFGIPATALIADYIKTREHADFLSLQLSHVAGVN